MLFVWLTSLMSSTLVITLSAFTMINKIIISYMQKHNNIIASLMLSQLKDELAGFAIVTNAICSFCKTAFVSIRTFYIVKRFYFLIVLINGETRDKHICFATILYYIWLTLRLWLKTIKFVYASFNFTVIYTSLVIKVKISWWPVVTKLCSVKSVRIIYDSTNKTLVTLPKNCSKY